MSLYQLIQEITQQELKIILEHSDQGFSLEVLKTIKTPEEAENYIRKHLEKTGEGWYRTTFGIDETAVIKLNNSDSEDVMQNAKEARNARCLPKKYVAQLLDKHQEFWWIVMERVQTLSRAQFVAEFEKRVGGPVPFKTDGKGYELEEKEAVIMLTIHAAVEGLSGQNTAVSNQWMKSKWYAGLIRALRSCQVHAEDFHYKNWGIRPSTGELVLLDLGF